MKVPRTIWNPNIQNFKIQKLTKTQNSIIQNIIQNLDSQDLKIQKLTRT